MKLLTDMDLKTTIATAVIPFIPLDIVKCFAAAGIAKPLRRLFPTD